MRVGGLPPPNPPTNRGVGDHPRVIPTHWLFPPGNPSIEVGGFAPHLNGWVSRRAGAVWSPNIGFC